MIAEETEQFITRRQRVTSEEVNNYRFAVSYLDNDGTAVSAKVARRGFLNSSAVADFADDDPQMCHVRNLVLMME
jgi:hypothetical protein